MTLLPNIRTGISVCPHDCPSTCALEVEILDGNTIGRVRGAKDHPYTAGVICEKVARYAERIHHPDRLLHPLKRTGPKGSGQFTRISWEEALEETAQALLRAEREHGPESVWPYYYAGTMGLVMRDGIDRLRHAKNYSGMYGTFCISLSWAGYYAGAGRITGTDSREMQKSDLIVVWGGNPVNTQVNVMTQVQRARKARGAKLAVVDVYDTATMQQADVKVLIRPGTDGALACAIMHVLFRDGLADRTYMARHTDDPESLEAHLATRTPQWAEAICGLPAAEIESFAHLIGKTPRSYFRLGYGFTRQRNGAANMHAVLSIPAVTGAWQHEGGGALHSSSGLYRWNKSLITGRDLLNPTVRVLDQSRIGAVLNGNPEDLRDGPPVKALFIQNTNPLSVAPDQESVRKGFAREDLFVCVHEQFMTDTAAYADIYQASGHSHIQYGRKLVEPPGECRSNHEVISALARKLGAEHRGFAMSAKEIIAQTLSDSGRPTFAELEEKNWLDAADDFDRAHFLTGFGHADGKYHFRADWKKAAVFSTMGALGPWADMPEFPDHFAAIEEADAAYPFRLTTSPARTFLNSSFNETPSSRRREGRPGLLVHPDDLAALGLADGDRVRVGSRRGEVILHARAQAGQRRGVVVAEGLWPNALHEGGKGINTLTGSDQPAPAGGGAFHDVAVWIRGA
jgi:anaerobic selenocysteine-containing dehydrogenase